jgi:catechol-2,3-dioxygenase
MPITNLNHAVLFVRDAEQAAAFYTNVLGFRRVMELPNAVFLQAAASNNDHDLGLFSVGDAAGASMAGRQTVGLYHLAWEVDTIDELERLMGRLVEQHALVGATDHGTTKAVYGRDPDGIEFELSWLVPADLLDPAEERAMLKPLDLAAEKQRYGATTRGGIGISAPRAERTASHERAGA